MVSTSRYCNLTANGMYSVNSISSAFAAPLH